MMWTKLVQQTADVFAVVALTGVFLTAAAAAAVVGVSSFH